MWQIRAENNRGCFWNLPVNVLKLAFPSSKISACLFHLWQCLLQKHKVENLFNIYETNITVKKFVKAFTHYPFSQLIVFVKFSINFVIPGIFSNFNSYFWLFFCNIYWCRCIISNRFMAFISFYRESLPKK